MMRRALTVHRLPTTDGAIGGYLCLVVTEGLLSSAAELLRDKKREWQKFGCEMLVVSIFDFI